GHQQRSREEPERPGRGAAGDGQGIGPGPRRGVQDGQPLRGAGQEAAGGNRRPEGAGLWPPAGEAGAAGPKGLGGRGEGARGGRHRVQGNRQHTGWWRRGAGNAGTVTTGRQVRWDVTPRPSASTGATPRQTRSSARKGRSPGPSARARPSWAASWPSGPTTGASRNGPSTPAAPSSWAGCRR